ncbi:transmembrane protein 33-like [Oppia nitens]|uniref:transmembrane protein 33-like n=1 Tax=Oppia nitens TaxID=1686743 RepID=UPI0023DA72FE|nr:transmembrane protein 33-like [Oppia nitens]
MADSSDHSSDSSSERRGLGAVVLHVMRNRMEAALFVTRGVTLVLTFVYLLGIWSPASAYQKALVAAAATSALRLHQRLPPFRLSREFLALVVTEDSAHYLLYALLFASNAPLALALLPVALFAGLHFASFGITLADKLGSGELFSSFANAIQRHQRSVLQTVALTEIALMPAVVLALLSGSASLLAPFLFYRFLALRYASRRNPYTRQMFYELRVSAERMSTAGACPALLGRAIRNVIELMGRLAPPIVQ